MQANILVKTLDIEHQEWLKYRFKGIGGSDVAAIAGLSPWKSPIRVYLEKIGEAPKIEENEAMRIGRDLEDYVAKRFEEATGFKTRRKNAILQNPEYPFALANIDRLIVGKEEGLECKTTSSYGSSDWESDKIPVHYELQCHHYMLVTGLKAWWIAVLIGNQNFKYKKIERDEEIIRHLIKIESDFWQMVENKTPPMMDGSEDADSVLNYLYPKEKPGSVMVISDLETTITELEEAKAEQKAIETKISLFEQQIKDAMKDNEKALIGQKIVTWKSVISNRIDSKRLKAEKPEIYKEYCNESSSRRFVIK